MAPRKKKRGSIVSGDLTLRQNAQSQRRSQAEERSLPNLTSSSSGPRHAHVRDWWIEASKAFSAAAYLKADMSLDVATASSTPESLVDSLLKSAKLISQVLEQGVVWGMIALDVAYKLGDDRLLECVPCYSYDSDRLRKLYVVSDSTMNFGDS